LWLLGTKKVGSMEHEEEKEEEREGKESLHGLLPMTESLGSRGRLVHASLPGRCW
jgi:hypothetical protein